ncbi:MAG TPA: hypothetical protein H9915_00005, partial [Candidatus Gemmiger faecigallinarum]|nr:hypothetical protein [Candidatus Gemmiger faecigallinarum]
FAVAQLLIEELSVDSAGYGQVTEAFQFRIELLYDFVSVGFGNAQFLRHFIDPHKRLFFCHTQKYLPFLAVIVFRLPFHPSDSDRQPFPALCRLLFSLARSYRRLLPRRKYLSDGHSVLLRLKFPLSLYNGHFFAVLGVSNL